MLSGERSTDHDWLGMTASVVRSHTRKNMKQCLLLILLFTVSETISADFYIDDGEAVRWVRGDEDQYQAIEWQIRLYRRSESATGDRHWGLITGKTAADVTQKLKDSQDTEKKWEKWTSVSWGELTNFNPLGPIAVLERKYRSQKVINKEESVKEKLAILWEAHKNLRKILYPRADGNPFTGAGSLLKEYSDNFKHIFQMQEEFRKIEESISNSEHYLLHRLGVLSSDIEKSQKQINSYFSGDTPDQQQKQTIRDNRETNKLTTAKGWLIVSDVKNDPDWNEDRRKDYFLVPTGDGHTFLQFIKENSGWKQIDWNASIEQVQPNVYILHFQGAGAQEFVTINGNNFEVETNTGMKWAHGVTDASMSTNLAAKPLANSKPTSGYSFDFTEKPQRSQQNNEPQNTSRDLDNPCRNAPRGTVCAVRAE